MYTIIKAISYCLLIIFIVSCEINTRNNDQEITSLEQALEKIDNYNGKVEDFTLRVSLQKRLTDGGFAIPQTLAWTIINDRIEKKGWIQNGFEEKNGFRIYKYKAT